MYNIKIPNNKNNSVSTCPTLLSIFVVPFSVSLLLANIYIHWFTNQLRVLAYWYYTCTSVQKHLTNSYLKNERSILGVLSKAILLFSSLVITTVFSCRTGPRICDGDSNVYHSGREEKR
jgi:hypothetical protein